MSDESSKATDDTVPAEPEEPMYEQLGEAGNPFEDEEQNPALPDQGQSDGNDEDLADQIPGPQG